VTYGLTNNASYICGHSIQPRQNRFDVFEGNNHQQFIQEEEYHLATYEDPAQFQISHQQAAPSQFDQFDEEPVIGHTELPNDIDMERCEMSPSNIATQTSHEKLQNAQAKDHQDDKHFENSIIPTYCDVYTTTNNDLTIVQKVSEVNLQAQYQLQGKLIENCQISQLQYRTQKNSMDTCYCNKLDTYNRKRRVPRPASITLNKGAGNGGGSNSLIKEIRVYKEMRKSNVGKAGSSVYTATKGFGLNGQSRFMSVPCFT